MSFGVGLGDIVLVSKFGFGLFTAFKNTKSDQTDLALDLESFRILVDVIDKRIAGSQLSPEIAASARRQYARCVKFLDLGDETTTKYIKAGQATGDSRRSARDLVRNAKWAMYKKNQFVQLLDDLNKLTQFLDSLLSTCTAYVRIFFL